MLNLKWSIRALLIVVAWCAILIVAIQSASLWWASITFSLTLLILGAAVVATINGAGQDRAFRLGFVIVGTTYFAMAFAPFLDRQIGHRLITTKLFALVHPLIHEKRPTNGWYGSTSSDIALNNRYLDLMLRSSTGPVPIAAPQWDPFQQICHSLITLPLAFLGGLWASFLRNVKE